ncbi:NfeD family protein [bacterium]|nr:NfeD family protein [bacterium]
MVMVYIWLAVLLASIIVELAVPALVSVWFAAGAFVSLILTSILTIFMGEDALFFIWLEILVFVIVSVLTVILIRPLILNRRKELKTNVDSMIGKVGIVEDEISKYVFGTAKFDGLVWTCKLADDIDETIESNELVEIIEIDGNKAIVKKHK